MKPISLSAQRVTVAAPRPLVFEVVASAGTVLEQMSENQRLVRFVTQWRGRTIETDELLHLHPPHHIDYSWVKGPLPEVQERIAFEEEGEGATTLVYHGHFSMGPGVLRWLIGKLRIKKAFDSLVRAHLEDAKTIAEQRARRSRRYPSSTGDG